MQKPGTKHGKIEHMATGHCSEIPRHTPINKYLLRDFVEDYLVRKCGLTEEHVYSHLWC